MNLIHASDSAATAEKELRLLFNPDELFAYDVCWWPWMYGKEELV